MSDNTHYNALPIGSSLPGARSDQYEIVAVLGAGGFGITYKAYDRILECEVAIKEYLPSDLAARRSDGATVGPISSSSHENYQWGLTRFLDEARTLSKFRKEPNIVRVENFIEANGTAYMVMQYEEGVSLDDYLSKNGILNEGQLKRVIIPILDGLRVVHDAGYLHRDIKPANIYLRKEGSPILLDFGAARYSLGEHSRSITSILTAGYAPIEQYSSRGNLSPATDLYALGATIHRCITGMAPPEATDRVNAIYEDETDPYEPLTAQSYNGYSQSLLETVNWLLMPRMKDRPENVGVVLDKLVGEAVSPGKGAETHQVNDDLSSSGVFVFTYPGPPVNDNPSSDSALQQGGKPETPGTREEKKSSVAPILRHEKDSVATVPRKKTFWKVFVWFLIIVGVIGIFRLFDPEVYWDFTDYAYLIFDIFLTVGVAGYAYNKAIFEAKYWAGMFWLAIILEPIYLIRIYSEVSLDSKGAFALALSISVTPLLIRWWGLYLYATRSDEIWAKGR